MSRIQEDIASFVLNTSFKIHKELGPGLFESVYEEILYHELISNGFAANRQNPIPVVWKGNKMEQGFRADLLIENCVIIEIKSIEAIAPVHHKQLLTYLRLTDISLGLLINFNEALLKNGIKRVVNNYIS